MKKVFYLVFTIFLSSNFVFSATEKQFISVEEVQESLKFINEPKNVQKARLKAFKRIPPLKGNKFLKYEMTDRWYCYPANKTRPYPEVDNDNYKRNITYFSDKTYSVSRNGYRDSYTYDFNCNLVEYGTGYPYYSGIIYIYNPNNELIKIFVSYRFRWYEFAPDKTFVGYWGFLKKYAPNGKTVIMTRSRSPIY